MIDRSTLLCVVNYPSNTGYAWDFIEGLYAQIADRLDPRGIRVLVAYPAISAPPATLEGSAAVAITLSLEPRSLADLIRLLRTLRQNRVRTIYLTDRLPQHWSFPIFRLVGVRRIVVHDHSSGDRTVPRALRGALKWIRARIPGYGADLVVTVSDYVARRHREVSLIPARRIRRVWNGVPVPTATVTDEGERCGVPREWPLLLCACRATPEKGVAELLRAFDLLPRDGVSPGGRPVLVFAGDGPALKDLERIRDGLSWRQDVHFLGYRSDVRRLLQGADICIVPSIWQDAFPLSVLQAMAMGKAVVATSVGGIPEMIDSPAVGRLVRAGDPIALSEAIAGLIDRPADRNAIGAAARRRVAEWFSPEAQIAALIECVAPGMESRPFSRLNSDN